MEATPVPTRLTTAIPARYREERDRVLQILARWDVAMRRASMPLTPHSTGPR